MSCAVCEDQWLLPVVCDVVDGWLSGRDADIKDIWARGKRDWSWRGRGGWRGTSSPVSQVSVHAAVLSPLLILDSPTGPADVPASLKLQKDLPTLLLLISLLCFCLTGLSQSYGRFCRVSQGKSFQLWGKFLYDIPGTHPIVSQHWRECQQHSAFCLVVDSLHVVERRQLCSWKLIIGTWCYLYH